MKDMKELSYQGGPNQAGHQSGKHVGRTRGDRWTAGSGRIVLFVKEYAQSVQQYKLAQILKGTDTLEFVRAGRSYSRQCRPRGFIALKTKEWENHCQRDPGEDLDDKTQVEIS